MEGGVGKVRGDTCVGGGGGRCGWRIGVEGIESDRRRVGYL